MRKRGCVALHESSSAIQRERTLVHSASVGAQAPEKGRVSRHVSPVTPPPVPALPPAPPPELLDELDELELVVSPPVSPNTRFVEGSPQAPKSIAEAPNKQNPNAQARFISSSPMAA